MIIRQKKMRIFLICFLRFYFWPEILTKKKKEIVNTIRIDTKWDIILNFLVDDVGCRNVTYRMLKRNIFIFWLFIEKSMIVASR